MFKNIIATAALVAASSALASAASVTLDLTTDYFGSSTQYATLDTSLFNNLSANVIAGTNLAPVRNYLVNRGTEGVLYYDNANDASISADGNKSSLSINEDGAAVLYIYNAGQCQTTVGYYSGFTAIDDLESVSAFTYSFTVSLTTTEEEDNDFTFGLYYVESSSGSVTQVALFTAITDGRTYTIDILSLLGEDVAESLLSGTGYLAILGQGDDAGTWRGANLTTTISATVTTIPEPSAFGLLAGVGALALAASRRRRTRKA